MPRTGLVVAAALLAAGCKKSDRAATSDAAAAAKAAPGDAAPPPPPDAAPQPALFDKLMKEVGGDGPVAVVVAKDGLVAVSLDGKRRQTLAPKGARWVLVDDRARVIWFQQKVKGKSDLMFLDLTLPAPVPEQAVTGLPEDELLGIGYPDKPGDEHPDVVGPDAAEYDGMFQLILDPKEPWTNFQAGQFDEIFEEQGAKHHKAIEKAKLVKTAVPRLLELAKRGDDRPLLLEAPDAKEIKVDAVSPDRCEDQELCGTGQPLPGSTMYRVLVSHGCGDACHVRWLLYDAKKQEFIEYGTKKRSKEPFAEDASETNVSDAYLSRDGKGFIVGGSVYRIDGQRVLGGTGTGGGWLGGQYHVGL